MSHLLGNINRYNVTFDHGSGVRLWDTTGREYLDFLGGIAVCALGHAHPALTEAIQSQAQRLLHVSNLYYTPEIIAASDAIAATAGGGRVYFCNSGTEANEAAIKFARKRAWRAGETDRVEIVSLEHAFHGRTMGSLAATISPAKWEGFQPLPAGFNWVVRDDVDALDKAVTDKTAAVLIEVVQGEGGVWPLDPAFVDAARRMTTERGALLIVDEVQTGVGRTARWWGFEHYGVRPDAFTTAKALGGGFPVGALWMADEHADVLRPGDHSTTQGGNPLACAAVSAVLAAIERDGLLAHCQAMSDLLRERLRGYDVRGKGLLLAIELGEPRAADVVRAALGRGLLVNDVTPSAVRLAPPLIVREADIDEAVSILREVL